MPDRKAAALTPDVAARTSRDEEFERLRQREAAARILVENVEQQHFIYRHDVNGIFTSVSPSIERILGYSAQEFCQHFATYLTDHPRNAEVVEHTRLSILGQRQPAYLVELFAKDGTVHWLEVVEVPVRDATGAVVAVEGLARDVTQRQHDEAALRESEQRFRELAASLPEALFEFGLDGSLSYVNDAALRNFGYSEEEFEQGLSVLEMVAPEDRARASQNIEARLRGEPRNEEYTALRKDGTRFPVQIQARPLLRDGRIVGMRGLVLDLSQRAQLEAERLRAQKLESIGILAGGIAHDFNNVLAAVLGNVELARLDLPEDHPAMESLQRAEKASVHGRALTQQLLTFARGGAPMKRSLALGDLLADAASMALAGTAARVEFALPDDLWPVEADAGQLSQVFSNLLINASQAMPAGGRIQVRGTNTLRPLGGDPGSGEHWVCVEIEDQGRGIAAADLPRVFDPYFTTKSRGSGLGLAVAYSVVQGHGGSIELRSELGRGTCAVVTLPAVPQAEVRAEVAPDTSLKGHGRVLVLDDDPQVRRVVEAMLGSLGYQPVGAEDGAKAIAALEQQLAAGTPCRAALLDLTVPGGLGGKEVVGPLRALDPSLRCIACSGYSDDPIMARHSEYGFDEALAKPFRREQLAALLHAVLAEDAGRGQV